MCVFFHTNKYSNLFIKRLIIVIAKIKRVLLLYSGKKLLKKSLKKNTLDQFFEIPSPPILPS